MGKTGKEGRRKGYRRRYGLQDPRSDPLIIELSEAFLNDRTQFDFLNSRSCLFEVTTKHHTAKNNEVIKMKKVDSELDNTARQMLGKKKLKKEKVCLEINNCLANCLRITNIFNLIDNPEIINVEFSGKPSLPLDFRKGQCNKNTVLSLECYEFGIFDVAIVFIFETDKTNEHRYLCKVLRLETETDISKSLGPVKQFSFRKIKKLILIKEDNIVKGPSVKDYKNSMVVKHKLEPNKPQKDFIPIVEAQLNAENVKPEYLPLLTKVKKILGTKSNPVRISKYNYYEKFKYLLFIEEIQEHIELSQFNMSGVCLLPFYESNRHCLQLHIGPGLSEKKPSLLCGGKVLVRLLLNHNCDNGIDASCWYTGYIIKLQQSSVLLLFDGRFHSVYKPYMKVEVRFLLARIPFMMSHRAVDLVKDQNMSWLLFPSLKEYPFVNEDEPHKKLLFDDTKIYSNPEQMEAVRNIVNCTAMPYPYLVIGPPGTGKTVVLVEAIKQNYCFNLGRATTSKSRKQLVCASSNAAADVITERIIASGVIPSKDILRMYSPAVKWSQVPLAIKKHGCHNFLIKDEKTEDQVFIPSLNSVMEKAVVITTLSTAGRLVSGGIPCNHFSHVFIDEAGNSMEPETLIPIMGIVTGDKVYGQIVLAGDPKQLGPVIMSFAKDYGLQTSLLERLMNTEELYQRDPKTNKHDARVVTKLVQNFRSHEAILKIPNKFFYNNELVVMGQASHVNKFCDWNGLVKKGFPVIFHAVVGDETREDTSPSFFNVQEINQIVAYIEKLTVERHVKQCDIGVVTPYVKQVQKITSALATKDWHEIDVGSVEKYQGNEKSVIIISTVRSKVLREESVYSLGFLRSPQRFNVAVTRAQALLIIVGNPVVLNADEHWGEILRYCILNGAYRGGVPLEDIVD